MSATHMTNFTGDDMPGEAKQAKAEPKGATPKSVEDELKAQSADPKAVSDDTKPVAVQDETPEPKKAAPKKAAAKKTTEE